ncbi:MAG TPA: hypothetical protein VGM49_06355, partial [Candidatus Limnocylindrales bacterium]
MKGRLATAFALGIAVASIAARPGVAAIEVAVSLSPTMGIVGHPVEVSVRTFVPFSENAIDLPRPSLAYPAPSGLWDVLYPIDYEFDVVARSPTGEELKIDLARDGSDASLWRGSFTPVVAGQWSIVMGNFPTYPPIQLDVAADAPNSGVWLIAITALIAGLA